MTGGMREDCDHTLRPKSVLLAPLGAGSVCAAVHPFPSVLLYIHAPHMSAQRLLCYQPFRYTFHARLCHNEARCAHMSFVDMHSMPQTCRPSDMQVKSCLIGAAEFSRSPGACTVNKNVSLAQIYSIKVDSTVDGGGAEIAGRTV